MQQRSPAFFALIALGVVLLLAGIVYGLGSRQVQYKSVPQGSIAHYLSSGGTGYLQMEGNPSLYIVHQDNFSPKIPTFADSDTVSFVYDPAETTSVDVKSTIGTHLVGNASKVVAITSSDTTGQKTYTTPEYVSSPQGYNHNQWPIGIGLLVVGLLLAGASFFLPKKKLPVMTTSSPFTSAPMQGQPQQFPSMPGTFPYGQQLPQTYPTPYPSTPQNYQPQSGPLQQAPFTGYSQQPNPLGQPQQQPNPLGQPQQQPNPLGQPQQQPNPFGQPQQQPNPFGQPQQQPNPFGQPQQPNPFGQPQQPSSPPGQFLRPKPYNEPSQQ